MRDLFHSSDEGDFAVIKVAGGDKECGRLFAAVQKMYTFDTDARTKE